MALPLAMMLVPRVEATLLSPPVRPPRGAAGDHFIVPRTPFRMASNGFHIRLSYKAGLCPICNGLRFNGKKRLITTAMVDLYIHMRKPQSPCCACDRKQRFRTPHKTKNPSSAWDEMVPTNTFQQ